MAKYAALNPEIALEKVTASGTLSQALLLRSLGSTSQVETYPSPFALLCSLNRVLRLSKRDWMRFGVVLAAIANQL